MTAPEALAFLKTNGYAECGALSLAVPCSEPNVPEKASR